MLRDVYITEKIGTKQQWSHPAPDEACQLGYTQELRDFMESVYHDRKPFSGIALARDTIEAIEWAISPRNAAASGSRYLLKAI